ncbi:MAG: FG-GAP repeat protein, partial [Candidatus Omnitrophica bacterium]|nr:FG-GAP repeat protein [Candidatus Omnitrophota bacterium]
YRAGKAFLYLGTGEKYSGDYDLAYPHGSFLGEFAVDSAGFSVSGIGDINSDNLQDFAVGANGRDNGKGYIYVFYGSDIPYSDLPTPTPTEIPSTPLRITALSPSPGSTIDDTPTSVMAQFNRAVDPDTVNSNTFKLTRSGGDGVFGNGNDVLVTPSSISVTGQVAATLNLAGIELPADTYRVSILGGGTPSALSFDGVNDYVDLPNDLIHASTVLTLEARFKTTSTGVIFGYQDHHYSELNGDFVPCIFVGTDGKLQAVFWDEDHVDGPRPVMGIQSSQTVNDGEWHHVALVGNNTSQKAYLDGELIGERQASILHWDMIYNQIGIGQTRFWGQVNGGWFPFNGLIDEVRLWNVARSQQAIQEDMNLTLSGEESNLVAYWNFDEGEGQVAGDLSPNAHHGELGSTPGEDANDPTWSDGTGSSLGVTDLYGMSLDGEFEGSFPSGDGTPGGHFIAQFVIDPNDPPTAPTVHITPEEPNTLDDLIATVSGSVDPDGGELSYAFEWFRDGESQNETSFGSEESSVVSHDRTTRGEVWKCLVTVQDDEGQSVTGEDEVTIQNSLPTQPEIKTLPPNPMPGDGIAVLITKQSTDADGDVIVYLFEWYRLNSDGFWERRPEVSGNLSPFSPGEPEISGLYTAGEMWEVRVTPYEARTLVKRSGQKGVGGAVSGPSATDRWVVLPNLNGDRILDIHDLLLLVEMWHEEHGSSDEKEMAPKGSAPFEGVPTARDLILVSPLGWQGESED